MNLFFYLPRSNEKGDELLGAVASFVSHDSLEVFRDLPSLAERVRRPKDPFSVALIFNPAQEDLSGIISLRDFFKNTRTLLVLPDQQEETVKLAHKIFPTFISYVDNDISGIISVLKKLANIRGQSTSI